MAYDSLEREQKWRSVCMSELAKKTEFPSLVAPCGAFEPVLDRLTLEIHHGRIYKEAFSQIARDKKYHQLLCEEEEMPFSSSSCRLEAGRVYDCHQFYFNGITPPSLLGLRLPQGKILAQIQKDFISFESFFSAVQELTQRVNEVGFLWCVYTKRGMGLRFLPDHQTPPSYERPLFCIDLWEHAYFLRYHERKDAYIYGFFRIIDWTVVQNRLEKIKK